METYDFHKGFLLGLILGIAITVLSAFLTHQAQKQHPQAHTNQYECTAYDVRPKGKCTVYELKEEFKR
jgi:hypothetical protein